MMIFFVMLCVRRKEKIVWLDIKRKKNSSNTANSEDFIEMRRNIGVVLIY